MLEPAAAGPDIEKPYLVVVQGTETEDSPWVGFRRIIEIWPYLSRTSFTSVDAIYKEIVAKMENQLITDPDTGEVFSCMHLGAAGPDVVVEDWDAITKGIRFAVLVPQPLLQTETYENDPWVEAIAAFTETVLEDWTVYRDRWPMGYTRPSVLWRLDALEMKDAGSALVEVTKTLVGHVLGSTPNYQVHGIAALMGAMAEGVKIPLDIADRRYMTVRQLRASMRQNALTAGQISLVLSRKTRKPAEEVPLMMHVGVSGGLE